MWINQTKCFGSKHWPLAVNNSSFDNTCGNVHVCRLLWKQKVSEWFRASYCHVSGVCVTNNNGFCIWWSNLLHLHATGYNSSQITIWHTSSSDWTLHGNYSDFQLNWAPLLRCTPSYSFNSPGCALLYFLGTDPTENAVFCCQKWVFIGPLPSNGYPIVESVTSGMCLPSRCLAMGIYVTIFIAMLP
jgi:hypothetical protein